MVSSIIHFEFTLQPTLRILPAIPNIDPPLLTATIPHCQEHILPISLVEAELVVSGRNPKKAPGLDRIQGSHLSHSALVPLLAVYIILSLFRLSNNTLGMVLCTIPPKLETK